MQEFLVLKLINSSSSQLFNRYPTLSSGENWPHPKHYDIV